jgi:hypothetical protein
MARSYSTRAAARQWSVYIFSNILGLAAINAQIIYRSVTGKNEQACLSQSACREITGGIRTETCIYGSKTQSRRAVAGKKKKKKKSRKRNQCQVGM